MRLEMDYRTELEKQCHETMTQLIAFYDHPKIWRSEWVKLLGRIRDMNVALENKRLGCKSGRHRNECLCQHGIIACVDTIKDRRRNHHAA